MCCKIVQFVLGATLTLVMFSFVSWGDFSWVTLTGPITLEADLGEREAAGYIASPALQAVIVRLLFLLACLFFCMIPNLARGLRQHARYLLGLAVTVYLHCSYFMGSFTVFASHAPEMSKLRIAVLVAFFILLVIGYDASRQKFKVPEMLLRPDFLVPLTILATAVSGLVTGIFQGPSWLFEEHIYYVLLRIGLFLTALTGAIAFYLWRGDNEKN